MYRGKQPLHKKVKTQRNSIFTVKFNEEWTVVGEYERLRRMREVQ